MTVSPTIWDALKGNTVKGSGGRVRELSLQKRNFHAEGKSIKSGRWCISFPLEVSLIFAACSSIECHHVKSPYCSQGCLWLWEGVTPVPGQATFKGNLGVGQPGVPYSFSRTASSQFRQAIAVPGRSWLVAGEPQMWSKQLEAVLLMLILRGRLTSTWGFQVAQW